MFYTNSTDFARNFSLLLVRKDIFKIEITHTARNKFKTLQIY